MLTLEDLPVGVVENVNDPYQQGGVQVRVVGIHTDSLADLPTASLPWAYPLGSIYSASISGVGATPLGLMPGSKILLLPCDASMQQFVIMGSLGGGGSKYSGSGGFIDQSGQYPIAGYGPDMNQLSRGAAASSGALANLTGNASPATTTDTFTAANPPPSTLTAAQLAAVPWLKYAQTQIGISYDNNKPAVEQYILVGGGLNTHNTYASWCASFVGYCLNQVGITGTRSASARSYLRWGTSVQFSDPTKIAPGTILIFNRPPNPMSGHVGFAYGAPSGGRIPLLGGNQGGSNGEVKISNMPISDIIGAVWPTPANS